MILRKEIREEFHEETEGRKEISDKEWEKFYIEKSPPEGERLRFESLSDGKAGVIYFTGIFDLEKGPSASERKILEAIGSKYDAEVINVDYETDVFSWEAVSSQLMDYIARKKKEKIVLIGLSFGGDTVAHISKAFKEKEFPAELLGLVSISSPLRPEDLTALTRTSAEMFAHLPKPIALNLRFFLELYRKNLRENKKENYLDARKAIREFRRIIRRYSSLPIGRFYQSVKNMLHASEFGEGKIDEETNFAIQEIPSLFIRTDTHDAWVKREATRTWSEIFWSGLTVEVPGQHAEVGRFQEYWRVLDNFLSGVYTDKEPILSVRNK